MVHILIVTLLSFLFLPKTVNQDLPQGYFTFPIKPGQTTSLSGSFGDIRINHFHAGLDIRTGGRIGQSVFSAAEGYVSRIGVSQGGYGNALYITHPNGFTTVYGHLNEYAPKIKRELVKRQYELQQWQVDLYFEPNEILVKKGEMVAYSGNTGGSGGPHLHFEIRDAQERTIDPGLFGFREIRDNVPPHMEFLSVVCKSEDASVNGKFGTFDFPITKLSSGNYKISQPINIKGTVGFELYTYDKAQTTPFKLGIKELTLFVDGTQRFKYHLDRLKFSNKIDMNMHTNYKRMLEDKKKLHKLYYEQGNSLEFYEFDANYGLVTISQNTSSTILVRDTKGNESTLEFKINYNNSNPKSNVSQVNISRTLLHIESPFEIELIKKDETSVHREWVTLDLQRDLVQKIQIDSKPVRLGYNVLLGPDYQVYSKERLEFNLENQAYYNFAATIKNSGTRLQLHEDVDPLRGRFSVRWKPNFTGKKEKASVFLEGSKKNTFVGGSWNGDFIDFRPKEFGTYLILEDSTPPNVQLIRADSKQVRFKIKDELAGIKKFECFIDDEWVLMEYEYKNDQIWSEKLDNSKPFKGEVDLYVTDKLNNQRHFKTKI